MPIHVVCADCGSEYDLKEEYGGKKVRCKGCQGTIRVPQVAIKDDGLDLGIDLGDTEGGRVFPAGRADRGAALAAGSKGLHPVAIRDCVSREERKKRFGVALINGLLWMLLALFAFATMGVIVLAYGVTWLINQLLAEYNVRKLQALGTEATEAQFPEIMGALGDACGVLGIEELPKVIVVNHAQVNAFAIKFARKKVIVLLSETLEGVLDHADQLRFFLGHELGHVVLDHGKRGWFELYKPAAYKAAREMTCDNCGCAAAGNRQAAKDALKRLAVGNELYPRLSEAFLAEEARYIYSGITGWLIKQYLTYPPLGKRLMNVDEFAEKAQAA
jgi:Zn-dependent protease with chaperone function